MYKFLPFMTNDYSTGLFNEDTDDIYHSAFGALTEAYEKFVNPVNIEDFLDSKKELSVVDICYGIGYNTKALLNEFIKLKNSDSKISVDAVDSDKILMELSPIISARINFFKRFIEKDKLYINISSYETAKKIIEKNKLKNDKYNLNEKVNILILNSLIKNFGEKFLSDYTKKILASENYSPFFNDYILYFIKNYTKTGMYLHLKTNKSTFVHNIYYKYISKRYIIEAKKTSDGGYIPSNTDLTSDITLSFYAEDIRTYIKRCSKSYDIVLLDGFTPSKCPCIWSLDFFNKLSAMISYDGVIVTYNTSAPVRNALKQTGFYIGNTKNIFGKISGTIASKNKSKIKYPLSDKEFGLLDTKAGVVYRDDNLSLDNDTILINRKREVENSNLLSSSKYLKTGRLYGK